MNPLLQLHELGQSYWLDNLTRHSIQSGDLERRVRDEGLRGITSNPAIFHKAVSGHADYDEAIRELARSGQSPNAIYEQLATDDVRAACDVLRPVYDRTGEREGFVSLEVSPHLARDTDASIDEARRLHARVDRANLMIKIPGTPEGVPAVEELLYDGIDVNVTLLFSVEAYEQVADAYLRALERRLADGKPVYNVNSVASFFLSRIDTEVDKRLEAKTDPEMFDQQADPRPVDLRGKAAIANAKIAYQRFQHLLESERWKALADQGAHPQQLLWASTSTKNPKYRDVMYVEPLIGAYTVNTMPNETITAFADHGQVANTVAEGMDEAHRVMDDLAKLGIDFRQVTDQLLEEGIAKFVQPFDALLELIAEKSRALAS